MEDEKAGGTRKEQPATLRPSPAGEGEGEGDGQGRDLLGGVQHLGEGVYESQHGEGGV